MKYIDKIGLTLLVTLIVSSCNDFLDEKPKKGDGIELETFEQLEALLAARMEPIDRSAIWDCNAAQRYMSDCYEMPMDIAMGMVALADYTALELNCFQPKYTAEIQSSNSLWLCAYKNIFMANTVLAYLDKVTGGTSAQRATLAQRAHFIRAYNYYELVNCYCVPYCEANLKELGVPINISIEYNENYSRGTLKDVYDLIESELAQALPLSVPLIEGGERKIWRENSAAVNGFAARLYLTMGDYAKAKDFAEKALACDGELADYNTDIEPVEEFEDGNGELRTVTTWYDESTFDMTGLLSGINQKSYYRRYHFTDSWAIPSAKLQEAFDTDNDLRYKYFYYEEYISLCIMGMGVEYFEDEAPGYSYYNGDDFDSGPCVSEMLLIKAEAMARQGQWNDALTYLNTNFRPYRISSEAPADAVSLTAANKDEAIDVILKERMREFPFTLRWHDIRRCNFNNDPNDDVTITRRFYKLSSTGAHSPIFDDEPVEYTLTPKSNKYIYTMAIPSTEVTVSNGMIEQNKYE